MDHAIEQSDLQTLPDEAWLRDARASFDVGATLRSALAPSWTVEREVDPFGELSIVVLAAREATARPTFLLYEDNGLMQVSTFRGEHWERRQAFRTCQRAVTAILAAAGRLSTAENAVAHDRPRPA